MSKKNKRVVIQSENPVTQEEPQNNNIEKVSSDSDFQLGTFISKYASVLAILLLAIMAFVVYKDFILFKKAFLYKDIGSDTLNFYYPYGFLQAEYVHKYGLPSWSFQYGMGQSLMLFCLMDFFNIIFYIFDTENYVYLIIVREMLKLLCTGLVFFKYLKVLKVSNAAALYGIIILCFSGYMVLGGGWYIFSYDTFCVAFLLLAIELAFSRGQYMLIPIAVFFVAISQPFNLYLFSLFAVGYLILRHFQNSEDFNYKKFAFFLGKVALFGLVGLLISMPFFLENFFQMLESPRGSGEASYVNTLKNHSIFGLANGIELGTTIMRFFSSDILGTANAFKGYNNYLEAGIFYVGLPTLLLVPQVFGYLGNRLKACFGILLAFWVLPLIFPFFRYAIWGFVGDYYRTYSLIVSIFFILFGIFSFDFLIKTKKINWIVLLASIAVLITLTSLSYFPDNSGINKSILTNVRFLLCAYGVLLLALSKIKNATGVILVIFFGVLIGEEVYMARITVNKRDIVSVSELNEKIGYNDYSKEAIKYIKDNDKSPFYRMDKTFGSGNSAYMSLNDAMLHGYYGTTAYSSFNQKYYINYLQSTDVNTSKSESFTRWSFGMTDRTIIQSLNSVKYLLAKEKRNSLWKITHDSITTIGNITIFRHKFVLPLGYTHRNYMKRSEFEKLSMGKKDSYLLEACYVDDADVDLLKPLNRVSSKDSLLLPVLSFETYREKINTLKKDSLDLTSFSETNIKGKVNASANEVLYLSIPYDKGWHLKVDGNDQKFIKLDAGMSGVLLNKGMHQIELNYELPYFYKGLALAVMGVLGYLLLFVFRKKIALI